MCCVYSRLLLMQDQDLTVYRILLLWDLSLGSSCGGLSVRC